MLANEFMKTWEDEAMLCSQKVTGLLRDKIQELLSFHFGEGTELQKIIRYLRLLYLDGTILTLNFLKATKFIKSWIDVSSKPNTV